MTTLPFVDTIRQDRLTGTNAFFFLKGTQRISVRDKIMREIASNILIHREYVKAFPAKIVIDKTRILAENGNRALSHGLIYPKNSINRLPRKSPHKSPHKWENIV